MSTVRRFSEALGGELELATAKASICS